MSEQIQFTTPQLDAIRDVVNVGLISAADMLHKLLNKEISMSAEKAQIEEIDNLEIFGLIPAISAQLEYTGALSGKCVVIIGQSDVKQLLNLLMNIEDDSEDDELELDDITFNTIRELMTQMMNAYGATLSDFFGETLQVIVHDVIALEMMADTEKFFGYDATQNVVSLTTQFGVTDVMSSCYTIVFDNALTELMAAKSSEAQAGVSKALPQEDAQPIDITTGAPKGEEMLHDIVNTMGAPEEIPDVIHRRSAVSPEDLPRVTAPEGERRMQNVRFPDFNAQTPAVANLFQHSNMDLLMDVPLNVSVEIGKTRKKMREIMEFTQGTVIGLEKQAGAPVDIVVNGQLIARGDVVVIDDNFAVRVTEIVTSKESAERNRPE